MDSRYNFLGWITLDAGAWADWFSGAAALAAVVYAVTEGARRAAEKKQDERKSDDATRRLVAWRIIALLNESQNLYEHFWAAADKTRIGPSGEVDIWRSISPLIGHEADDGLTLTRQDLDYMMRQGAYNFLHQYLVVHGRYRSISQAIRQYRDSYQELRDRTPPPESMAGNVAVHSLTKEQILALMPYNAQVESLVRSIRHLLAENLRESHALLDEFQKFFEQKLGKKPIDMGKSDGMIKLEDIGKEIAR